MNIKSFGIALMMTAGLFIYGYLLSTAGHDHDSHGSGGDHGKTTVTESHHGHDNSDHGGDPH